MLARIHEEMLESMKHLDRATQGAIILSYIEYQIKGVEPDDSDPIVYAYFKAKQFDLDSMRNDVKASIINGASGGRPAKTWNNSQKPKITYANLSEPKITGERDRDRERENKNKNVYPPSFEKFWKEYPHARKGKKSDAYKSFCELDSDEVIRQASILKWKVKAGLQDTTFIPSCERWIRDFTPLDDSVVKQELMSICRWHMNAGGDMKQRASELKQTFGDKEIVETMKAIQQKDNPKNLFLNSS